MPPFRVNSKNGNGGNGDRARSRGGRGGPRSGERSYDLKPTFFLNLKPTLFIVGNQFAPGTEHFLGGGRRRTAFWRTQLRLEAHVIFELEAHLIYENVLAAEAATKPSRCTAFVLLQSAAIDETIHLAEIHATWIDAS
ncbi:hypothetical protein Pla52o_41540 [Novipirellula galeiformis]|uniref:Uncharacterized protein n=1 Tax=Novipirellula galeiformis TaxID=2528004 RepID=A0A5C6C959_9BACT|nr:hypothetical protein Pla52o_41540 [Novipirellula galeiformis]